MPFPFLLLPGELRNLILRHLLTHTTPIHTTSANNLSPPRPTPLHLTPSILATSHQLHTEALSILYAENTFQAHPTYLTSILFAIDPARPITSPFCARLITRFHVRVRLDCDTFYTKEEVVRAFEGAQRLEVEVFRASWGVGGYEALEGYWGVRGVGKARVHGSVGWAFARWLEGVMEGRVGEVVEGWRGEEGARYEDR